MLVIDVASGVWPAKAVLHLHARLSQNKNHKQPLKDVNMVTTYIKTIIQFIIRFHDNYCSVWPTNTHVSGSGKLRKWIKQTRYVPISEAHKRRTHLSMIKRRVVRVFRKQEHVYEVDQYAGSTFGLRRSVSNPLIDHHEHQVAKQKQQKEKLWDQHKNQTAELAKVPVEKEKNNNQGETRIRTWGCEGNTELIWNTQNTCASETHATKG